MAETFGQVDSWLCEVNLAKSLPLNTICSTELYVSRDVVIGMAV